MKRGSEKKKTFSPFQTLTNQLVLLVHQLNVHLDLVHLEPVRGRAQPEDDVVHVIGLPMRTQNGHLNHFRCFRSILLFALLEQTVLDEVGVQCEHPVNNENDHHSQVLARLDQFDHSMVRGQVVGVLVHGAQASNASALDLGHTIVVEILLRLGRKEDNFLACSATSSIEELYLKEKGFLGQANHQIGLMKVDKMIDGRTVAILAAQPSTHLIHRLPCRTVGRLPVGRVPIGHIGARPVHDHFPVQASIEQEQVVGEQKLLKLVLFFATVLIARRIEHNLTLILSVHPRHEHERAVLGPLTFVHHVDATDQGEGRMSIEILEGRRKGFIDWEGTEKQEQTLN